MVPETGATEQLFDAKVESVMVEPEMGPLWSECVGEGAGRAVRGPRATARQGLRDAHCARRHGD